MVLCRNLALPLKGMNDHGRLIVHNGGEPAARFARDGRIAFDQFFEDSANEFDAKRQRCHIDQQDFTNGTGDDR
jgi:hypothetical protein